jgi:hypothetical protein
MKGLAKDERSGKGLKGGAAALVYICALILPEGKCVADYARSLTNRARLGFEVPQILFAPLRSPPGRRVLCSLMLTDQGDYFIITISAQQQPLTKIYQTKKLRRGKPQSSTTVRRH